MGYLVGMISLIRQQGGQCESGQITTKRQHNALFFVCQYKHCSVARLPARNLEIGWKLVSREGGGGGLRLSQALTNMASGVGKTVIGIFAFSDSKVVIYYQWLWSRATHCCWEWYTAVCQCRTFDGSRTHILDYVQRVHVEQLTRSHTYRSHCTLLISHNTDRFVVSDDLFVQN